MARVDVTEVLVDPDFVDSMSIISRKPSVNSFGENILQEVTTQTIGSIQPASGKALQRLPESLRVANISSFWVKGLIVASAPGIYTDVLVFQGVRYQVQNVMDWSSWGAGWCEGLAIAQGPTGE